MTSEASELQRGALLAMCTELEEAAGIAARMAKAAEGRLMPLGIDGEPCTPDAYFADEYDSFRDQARDAYFDVGDIALRTRLIEARRQLDGQLLAAYKREVDSIRVEEAKALRQPEDQHWLVAAAVAAACVAIGYWQFHQAGAVGGAVVGYFLGQSTVASARRNTRAQISEIQSRLEMAVHDSRMKRLWPETFSLQEELTAVRDLEMDNVSALRNVRQHERDS